MRPREGYLQPATTPAHPMRSPFYRGASSMRVFLTVLAVSTLAGSVWAAERPPLEARSAATIEVMVLGTYHMGNPGLDLHNIAADDVLTPRRQAELAAVATALARFRPTVVAVERVAAAPGFVDPVYAVFEPAQLVELRDERVQIAYRLAHQLQIPIVYGVDEVGGDGEPDYFPFERVQHAAKAHGIEAQLMAISDDVGRMVAEFGARQASSSIAELLIAANDAGGLANASFYYRLLELDTGEDQPGAELLGYWTMRNAKIVSKLLDIAKPGDRIVLVYGAGHKAWLEQIIARMPGYTVVDPVPHLRVAAN
jgi:hypothetical protein